MDSVKVQQLKIFHLFLMADGEITTGEKAKLNAIYDAMKVGQIERETIEKFCRDELPTNLSFDQSEQIIQIIQKMLGEKRSYSVFYGLFGFGLNSKKSEQVKTIWNLINLGYSDKVFSEPEKKVVAFLCDYWSVDKKIIQELEDSAETLVSLTTQKEWIKITNKSMDEKRRFIENVEKDIKLVSRNIEMTIEEVKI